MRVNTLLALGAFAAVSKADLNFDDLEDAATEASSSVASAFESVTSSAVSKPTFTPTTLKAPFLEQFTDDWESRWQASHAKKEGTEEEWAYVGTWSVEEPTVLRGIAGDKGLVLKDKAAHHAISAKFPKAIDNTKKSLVVQYEAKFQAGLECGGAYMKLLQDNSALHAEEFSNASPYIIMFGPDKCGATNKVHFIFRHKNPKTGEYEEKHMKNPPTAKIGKTTALYTLIINPDQTYEIKINGESSRKGSLLEDFTPSVNPEKEIDDPNDFKPAEWVENAQMADPEAVKPADWDEEAPFEITDTEAAKPDDWLDNEPLMVPDPEAEKPEDWDDEEDGDWVPPMVPNPKCEEASGCGPWSPPMMANPAYKGKWSAPLIDNPEYKGVWAPQKIANPDYYEDSAPANLEPIGGVGFELWTMQNDILFDNIYIGHSLSDAEALAKETFEVKNASEKEEEEANKPDPHGENAKKEKPKSPMDLVFMDDPVLYIKERAELFYALLQRDPVQAIKFMPDVAGAIGVIILTILATLFGVIGAGGAAAAPSKEQIKVQTQKAKEAVIDAKDTVVENITGSAQVVQEEVQKRNTRSSTAVQQ